MSDTAWRWDERGSSIVVDVVPLSGGLWIEVDVDVVSLSGGLWVEVDVDGPGKRLGMSVELPPPAVVELAEWLDSASEAGLGQRLAEMEAECAQIEAERDAALARCAALERDVERMRAAAQWRDEVRQP